MERRTAAGNERAARVFLRIVCHCLQPTKPLSRIAEHCSRLNSGRPCAASSAFRARIANSSVASSGTQTYNTRYFASSDCNASRAAAA